MVWLPLRNTFRLTLENPVKFEPQQFCRTLVGNMSDALIMPTLRGGFVSETGAQQRIFGFADSEALGAALGINTPKSRRPRHWSGFNKKMQTGESRFAAGTLFAVPAIRKDWDRDFLSSSPSCRS